ncbi:MAG TPA: sensor histidine kinase [Thermoanaerobacterales bacterium]|jgi:sensor histidine kinase YesM|nr:sensor histidine kinase [Thermoanaerobacterales bacterium]
MKLKHLIFFSLAAIIVLSTSVMGLFINYIFRDSMTEQLAKSRLDVLAQISGRLNALHHIVVSFSDLYYFNDRIWVELKTGEQLEKEQENVIKAEFDELNKNYSKALITNGTDLSYAIITQSGYCYNPNYPDLRIDIEKYYDELWRYDFLKDYAGVVWLPTYEDIWAEQVGKNQYILSLARTITNGLGDIVGYFLVNIDENEVFLSYRDSLNDENSIYIVNADGRIVSHSDRNMIGFYFYRMDRFSDMFNDEDYAIIEKSGADYLFSRYYNEEMGWTIVEEIPMAKIMLPIKRIQNYIIWLCIGVIFLSALITYYIARRLTNPLSRLCNELKKIASSDQKVDFKISGWHEIGQICEECEYMNTRIDKLLKDVKETEVKKRKSELDFLYAQINPHFMHNTLFSLKCLIAMDRNKEAEEMVNEFSSLIQAVLQSSDELIPIREELFILNKYIIVQKYRYGNKFETLVNCKDEYLDCKVPRLILQPIIENSIFHGIEPSKEFGKILIGINRHGKNLVVEISDNGVGFDKEELKKTDENTNKSIGISNVHHRIQLLFGDEYGLNIKSEVGKGTSTTLVLPYIR